jgi:hypothetical protein
VVFHHLATLTRGLQELIDEDYTITPEILACPSPYKTEHINRFGNYDIRFERVPEPDLLEFYTFTNTQSIGSQK